MRFLLALFIFFPACPRVCVAEQAPPQSQEPLPKADQAPRPDLLRDAFQATFNKEQLSLFKTPPTPEQLAQRMSPEQRQAARAALGRLERTAKSPEDLKEVAKGYLLLDERSPNAGEGAARVAARLRELEPESPDGFALEASGLHQMGDYPAAAQSAKEALKRDPNDETAKAVFMLSAGRTRRVPATLLGAAVPAGRVPDSEISAQAQELMRQAVIAHREGDMDKTIQFAQAAMRAEPASSEVQDFYRMVGAERSKHEETTEYLRRSREALDAGRGDDAVMWAQKAADRSQHPTVYKILELTKQKAENPAASAPSQVSRSSKTPPNDGFPFWPVGAGLGLLGIGYGVYRGTKQAYSSEEGLNPSPEVSPEQARANYLKVATTAGALLLALAAWEFGPGALTAARTMLAAAGPAGPGMTPALAGAGAGSGAIPMGEVVVGAAKAGVLTGGAYLGAKTLPQAQTEPDLPALSFAKGTGDEKENKHPHGIYEASPKHGSSARGGPGGKISKSPQNPQGVLDDSIQIKKTSRRRVGINYETGEFNIFSETESRKWHGFAMNWDELSTEARNALIQAGKVTRRGRILKKP